jgi:hypothetical protein
MKRAKAKQQRDYETRHCHGSPLVQVSHFGVVLEKPALIDPPANVACQFGMIVAAPRRPARRAD